MLSFFWVGEIPFAVLSIFSLVYNEFVLMSLYFCVFFFGLKGVTLLEIKKSIRDVDNVLYDWSDSPSADYCVWRGVTCDNATFNIVAL